ncbi:hypothetical protein [Aeromonas dhakensis]|uniref:hypothetical protein n=1 Tax=Aeromonas dhakensis TaxID=196024 RepID=UPI00343BAA3E
MAHDISYLGSVFAAANPVFNIPVDNKLILEARKTLNNLKLVGKAQKRPRRPVSDELERIIQGLEKGRAIAWPRSPTQTTLTSPS